MIIKLHVFYVSKQVHQCLSTPVVLLWFPIVTTFGSKAQAVVLIQLINILDSLAPFLNLIFVF